jgi:hypothetical protein
MRVECSGPGCGDRRAHRERPFEPRDVRFVEVPEDFVGKAYCSIECAAYAGVHLTKKIADGEGVELQVFELLQKEPR